jgi:hypothetical protein
MRVADIKKREGRGKSALGFLERSGLEARISDVGEAFWAHIRSKCPTLDSNNGHVAHLDAQYFELGLTSRRGCAPLVAST